MVQFDAKDNNIVLVVDDHPIMLESNIQMIRDNCEKVTILSAGTADEAWHIINSTPLDLVLLDLQIPQTGSDEDNFEVGIELLKRIMNSLPNINIAVMSSKVKTLIRVRNDIDNHRGGFSIIEKSLIASEIVERINCAILGYSHTQALRNTLQSGLELNPKWMTVLELAAKGLQDEAIARNLYVQKGTVRHYWSKIYDALDIYTPHEKKNGNNPRTITLNKARQLGLID